MNTLETKKNKEKSIQFKREKFQKETNKEENPLERIFQATTIPKPPEQESYVYRITNLTENRYRFQFNRLRVIFEPNETKIVDLSFEPAWKLALKVLPTQEDAKTNEKIFKIEKVRNNEL